MLHLRVFSAWWLVENDTQRSLGSLLHFIVFPQLSSWYTLKKWKERLFAILLLIGLNWMKARKGRRLRIAFCCGSACMYWLQCEIFFQFYEGLKFLQQLGFGFRFIYIVWLCEKMTSKRESWNASIFKKSSLQWVCGFSLIQLNNSTARHCSKGISREKLKLEAGWFSESAILLREVHWFVEVPCVDQFVPELKTQI